MSNLVKDFSRRASDDEWDGVDEAARGADQPILSGLRYIVGSRLGAGVGAPFLVGGRCSSAWVLGPVAGGVCAQ
jgi:hypothetical protein